MNASSTPVCPVESTVAAIVTRLWHPSGTANITIVNPAENGDPRTYSWRVSGPTPVVGACLMPTITTTTTTVVPTITTTIPPGQTMTAFTDPTLPGPRTAPPAGPPPTVPPVIPTAAVRT